ncbi:MAG: 3-oxoacyl-ACP synthase, partial [Epsilonproteobacteria bacterium]|nr:3-oxoacyl-ACP synthase [Campylobacterota bacterium]
MYAAFRSIGAYVPSKVLTNSDLEAMVDTSDEWITKRTGIKERHIAAENETTSDMGAKAAELAIKRSGIAKHEIDML